MSKVKFTDSQKKAIEIRNKNIIVSAQAGAGKTQVLVGRIISLLEETRIDITNMLIVTFTNKAAAEMKDRIKKEISSIIQDDTRSLEDIIYFQKQYNLANEAQISTLHSFGINVLRKYFYKLGLNPKFKIIQAANLDIIKWQSIREVFDELYKKEDENFYNLLNIYSEKYNDDDLKLMIFNIYTFMQSQLKPLEWLKESIEKYHFKEYYNTNENIEKFKSEIYKFQKEKINNLLDNIYTNLIEAEKQDFEYKLYEKTFISDKKLILNLREIYDYDKFNFEIESLDFETLPRISKKQLDEIGIDEEYKKNIQALINKYRKSIKGLKNFIYDVDKEIEYENQSKQSLITIYKIIEEYQKKFTKNKLEKDFLDFNDIEHLTLKLLEDEEIVNELKNDFKYIFFDEYQDANQIQDEIVDKISSDDNLFFVGDIKQAIYRFRLANPILFKNRYEKYKNENNSEVIDLYENFRTEKTLLDFNNFLFNNLMTDKLGDVDYNTKEHRLSPGKKDEIKENGDIKPAYHPEKSGIYIDYIYAPLALEEEFDIETKNINPEAILVAEKINFLVNTGKEYGDIAILSRSKKIFSDIMNVLEKYNIPYFYDASGFSFDDIELKVFIEILKVINNDFNDISLISALTSTMGNLSDEDLAYIRSDDKKHSFNYCVKNFLTHDYEAGKLNDIKVKLENFYEKLSHYRQISKTNSLEDFTWYVLIDSGYMSYILAKENGDRIFENIKFFIDEIATIEKASFQTLSSLISYIERMQKRSLTDRESNAELSEKDNVVRIMSMHGSKGLDFNITILVELDKSYNTSESRKNFVMDDSGIALKVYDKETNENTKSFYFDKIMYEKTLQQYSEEMRLFYVALTRAKDEIHLISSTVSETISGIDNSTSNLNSFHKLLYYTLSRYPHIDDIKNYELKNSKGIVLNEKEKLSDIIQKNSFFEQEKLNNLYFNKYKSENLYKSFEERDNENEKISYTSELHGANDDISEIMQFSYDMSKTNIPFKKTVTEISAKDDNKSQDFKDFEILIEENSKLISPLDIKPIFQAKKEIDALSKGSLYHFLFEIFPIEIEDEKALDKYFLSLLQDKIITQEEYNLIDKTIFLNFMNNPISKRMKKAKENNKLFSESSFTMKKEIAGNEYLINGQLDILFEEEDGYVILDYKTNKRIDLNIYKEQLDLYKEGVEKATGKKVKEKLIYWIMYDEISEIE